MKSYKDCKNRVHDAAGRLDGSAVTCRIKESLERPWSGFIFEMESSERVVVQIHFWEAGKAVDLHIVDLATGEFVLDWCGHEWDEPGFDQYFDLAVASMIDTGRCPSPASARGNNGVNEE